MGTMYVLSPALEDFSTTQEQIFVLIIEGKAIILSLYLSLLHAYTLACLINFHLSLSLSHSLSHSLSLSLSLSHSHSHSLPPGACGTAGHMLARLLNFWHISLSLSLPSPFPLLLPVRDIEWVQCMYPVQHWRTSLRLRSKYLY